MTFESRNTCCWKPCFLLMFPAISLSLSLGPQLRHSHAAHSNFTFALLRDISARTHWPTTYRNAGVNLCNLYSRQGDVPTAPAMSPTNNDGFRDTSSERQPNRRVPPEVNQKRKNKRPRSCDRVQVISHLLSWSCGSQLIVSQFFSVLRFWTLHLFLSRVLLLLIKSLVHQTLIVLSSRIAFTPCEGRHVSCSISLKGFMFESIEWKNTDNDV